MQVKIIKSNRKTISIEVRMEEVIVKAPQRMTNREIQVFLEKKRDWIVKHQKIMQERAETINDQPGYTEEEIE